MPSGAVHPNRKPGLKLSLWDGITPLGESRGGTPASVRAPKERAPHPQDAAVGTLRLPAFRFLRLFRSPGERSETRGAAVKPRSCSRISLRSSGLRNDETRVSEDKSQAPPLTFSKPSRVRHANRASLAPRGMRRRMPFSHQCLVIKLEIAHSQKRTRREIHADNRRDRSN